MTPTSIKILVIIFGFFGGIKASHIEALYHPNPSLNNTLDEIEFWHSKVNETPGGFIHLPQLAAAKEKAFAINGNATLLKEAENHLLEALEYPNKSKVPTLCALASNYISQHRFCDALDIVKEADTYSYDRRMTELLLFDVYLELGWENEAEKVLHTIGLDRNFDYLIRRAKWEDGKGKLDLAVSYLERAREMAERSKQLSQLSWIYSNLGDFYGHQGEIEASKASFEQALAINPSDAHSLKGLAWIQYSAFGNTQEAIDMINGILLVKQSPDLLMLKAEMYERKGRLSYSKKFEYLAFEMMKNPSYGRMYQLPIAVYEAKQGQFNQALALIENEIEERPTPEVFAVYSSVLWHSGDKEAAKRVATSKVIDHTFEPKALLNILPIAVTLESKDQILDELAGTSFEIGPVAYGKFDSFLGT